MFEIGFSELVLILLVALVVLGPERLPKAAAKLGQLTGQARSYLRSFMSQLQAETQAADLRNAVKPEMEAIKKDFQNITATPASDDKPNGAA